MIDLATGLKNEIERNKELLQGFNEIGMAGKLGAYFIEKDIKKAEQATANNDLAKMLVCYNTLVKNN